MALLRRLGEEVTVVTQNTRQEFLDLTEEAGARIFQGDARADHVLLNAGLRTAKALICCISDDVTNIEIALDSRRLCPNLLVVVRLFDQTLARRLETSAGIRKALGMSVLAAPAFAAAALGERVFGAFSWRSETYVATTFDPEDGDACRLAVVQEVRESIIEAIVPLDDYAKLSLGLYRARPGASLISKARSGWESIVRFWVNVPKLLRNLSIMILVFSTISVSVFQVGLHLSLVDALYFVITTVTTTGYGDISLKDAPQALKLYGCLLMLLGSASVATLYSLVTDFVVSARFNDLLGRRVNDMTGHVIVVGLGNVGLRTAQTLVEMGTDVAVVELDPEAPNRQFLDKRVAFTAGDGRDNKSLERAGIRSARAVVAATENDAVNLSVGLAAKTLKADSRVIVRIFDAGFARKVEEVMALDGAISASRIAAPGFVGAALFPDALVCYVHDERFCIVRENGAGELHLQSVALRLPNPST